MKYNICILLTFVLSGFCQAKPIEIISKQPERTVVIVIFPISWTGKKIDKKLTVLNEKFGLHRSSFGTNRLQLISLKAKSKAQQKLLKARIRGFAFTHINIKIYMTTGEYF